ncbi:1196_t:CDS:1 [Entrophospora sp. SA101]|nr:13914_t:CDS:1 [Entrophospora sp. SA101]CAJ0634895.1 1196_t:CDS:1 [Entrophospora sp. SA101]CAJ0862363.1 1529_t:CDS:1 [Entrophospora sp. SA101]CAJ0894237.1 10345_t:CDS:1 [Entrophospora sp. SA101]
MSFSMNNALSTSSDPLLSPSSSSTLLSSIIQASLPISYGITPTLPPQQNFQDLSITRDESTPETTQSPSLISNSNDNTSSSSSSSSSESTTPPDSLSSLLSATGLTFPAKCQHPSSSQVQVQAQSQKVQSRSCFQSHSHAPAPSPPPVRRGGRKIQTGIDPKLARRRELNRKAAQRSRQKFKEFHHGLIDKVIELRGELDGLEAEYVEIIKS